MCNEMEAAHAPPPPSMALASPHVTTRSWQSERRGPQRGNKTILMRFKL